MRTVAQQDVGDLRFGAAQQALWQRLANAGDAAEYCHAWLALQCAQIDQVGTAFLLLRDEAGTFLPAAVWPDPRADVSHMGPFAQRCLAERRAISERPAGKESRLYAAWPLEEAGEIFGTVVLDLAARAEPELQRLWRALHWGSGRIEVLLLRRLLQTRAEATERARLTLDMAISIGEQPRFDEALLQLANELVQRLACSRVAVGIEKRGRIRLRALSQAATVERRSEFSAAIENAMEEAADQGCTVVHPPPVEGGGAIAVAHRDLARQGGACTVVISLRGRCIGAVTCLGDTPFDAAFVAAAEAAIALLAPNLALRRELQHWFAGRAAEALRAFWRGCRDPRRLSFRVGTALAALLLLWLGFAHGEYRVTGRAVIEGELQRALVAPFDGFVASAEAKAGQRVRAGDALLSLDDRDLKLDQQRWLAEAEQAERKYRDALARHDRANARILAAELAEARAQVALVEDRLTRARIVAPFDGILVSGDLSQMLGTPVEKGKVLLEIAPLDDYRVILKVPEEAIREVRLDQQGELVLAGRVNERIPFKVRNIGVAFAEEGENLFRVEAALETTGAALRPGMEGVGKIAIGERRLLWIWTHPFFDWLRLKLWYWLP
jgi:multidrug efflux pump subunit AcrA (membrane-fusion protein)